MAEARPVPIILVDDDPDEHFLFQADLEDSGLEMIFHAFTQGEAALDFLQARDGAEPCLILTDLSIPGGDPVEFIRQALPTLNGGAVGVYSGAINPDMETQCREAGATFYIVKPVTREKLEAVIDELDGLRLGTADAGKVQILPGR